MRQPIGFFVCFSLFVFNKGPPLLVANLGDVLNISEVGGIMDLFSVRLSSNYSLGPYRAIVAMDGRAQGRAQQCLGDDIRLALGRTPTIIIKLVP